MGLRRTYRFRNSSREPRQIASIAGFQLSTGRCDFTSVDGENTDALVMKPPLDRDHIIVYFLGMALVMLLISSNDVAPVSARHFSGRTRTPWMLPLIGVEHLIKGFMAPQSEWGPGHRGADYLTTEGAVVLAPADGTVKFAGTVATKPVLTIATGQYLASFEPVCGVSGGRLSNAVGSDAVGGPVQAGQVIGTVCGSGYQSHCDPQLCLHFSARNASGYLSPQYLMGQLSPSVLVG